MAGHSHAKNVAVRKGAQDKRKAKAFSKVAREITVAVKITSNNDLNTNPRLRLAVSKGREINMPNDRIKRAIEQGMPGGGDDAQYEEIRYEGYGPSGVAVIVECLTDNRTRTVADVRSYFVKVGGVLGETNSVAFMFQHMGEIIFDGAVASADAMFEAALEAGADNVDSDDTGHRITCAPNQFGTVRAVLEEKFGPPAQSGIIWEPLNTIDASLETAQSVMKLQDLLEDHDDVQAVYTSMALSDTVSAALEAVA
jgi:YebC/PmpR family DNA-binding regulatory protein